MSQILPFAVALFIGLLVGIERERVKGTGPTRREAGSRTFTIASLLGAVAMALGGGALVAVVLAITGGLLGVAYFRRQDDDPGLTTEVALLSVVLLGGLSYREPLLAAGLGVALAIILAAKSPIHSFVRDKLTQAELRDAFILAFATVIIWPALPDQSMGPFDAINPHKLWSLVILVMIIGGAGHVTTRAIGEKYGLPFSGFASGFVSSTATIATMGRRASDYPTQLHAAAAGGALSTVSTFLQMGALLAVANPQSLAVMTPALLAGGLTAALYGIWFTWRAANRSAGAEAYQGGAFSVRAALTLAGLIAMMLLAAAILREHLGQTGVIAGAAVAGFADAHAAAISVASLAAEGRITPREAVAPILAALTCNAATKAVMALAAGPRGYSARIIPGLILSTGAAWLAHLATSQP